MPTSLDAEVRLTTLGVAEFSSGLKSAWRIRYARSAFSRALFGKRGAVEGWVSCT